MSAQRSSLLAQKLPARPFLFATVDLPKDYAHRDEMCHLPHWHTLVEHPTVDGLRFNLTKYWNVHHARWAIRQAHAAGKRVMVDLIGKLRIRGRQHLQVEVTAGRQLEVALPERDEKTPYQFTRQLDLVTLPVGQPVILRDGRAGGHISAVDQDRGVVTIVTDRTDEPTLTLLEPPVNLPGYSGTNRGMTRRDWEWLERVVLEWNADYVALSFVEEPARTLLICSNIEDLTRNARTPFPITVLKIETALGVTNLSAILEPLQWRKFPIMVEIARGDLDNEVDLDLGWAEERIFATAKAHGVPVGIATGLLASMRDRPYASRAEKIDVWAALQAGARFLVLTDETANEAQYPAKAIDTLADLVSRFGKTRDMGGRARKGVSDAEE